MNPKLLSLAVAMLSSFALNGSATTHYVDANGSNPTPPYLDWTTAATAIQDAVDASVAGDLVLVTNGIYVAGGRTASGSTLTNRVTVARPITVQSVNGPAVTTIQGYTPATTNGPSAIRCAWLTNNASLIGFLLKDGATLASGTVNDTSGGGLWCAANNATVSDCVMSSNVCAQNGGAVYQGTLLNCVLTNNLSQFQGGGSSDSAVLNCLVAGNLAWFNGGGCARGFISNSVISGNTAEGNSTGATGGGIFLGSAVNCSININSADFGSGVDSTTVINSTIWGNAATVAGAAYTATFVNSTIVGNVSAGGLGGLDNSKASNCIVYFNTSTSHSVSNYDALGSVLDHCCTVPMPSGIADFTNPPLFINSVGSGDYHLQSNSPCINAGNNIVVSTSTDFDGNPRIRGGTVDVGAYEYQTPTSILSYAWAQQYGFPTDGSADFADPDGDGMNNWEEWIAGTNPTNALSVLALLSPAFTNSAGVTVTWQSVTNQTYYLQRATNLSAIPAFSSIRNNIVGRTGFTTFLDTSATNSSTYFYRVGIQQPYANISN